MNEKVLIWVNPEDLELIANALVRTVEDAERRERDALRKDSQARYPEERVFPYILSELHEEAESIRQARDKVWDMLIEALQQTW